MEGCKVGEWFVFNKASGLPQCERAPRGCPTDGNHVYWSRNRFVPKRCLQLGTEGPCFRYEILHINESSLEVSCQPINVNQNYA